MKSTLKLLLPGFILLSSLFLLSQCSKDDGDITTCDLDYLERINKDWVLGAIQWHSSDPGTLYDDCPDLDCIHFNLALGDSTYNLSYLITRENGANEVDTFQHVEEGLYQLDYCHISNMNANGGRHPGGFTNRGDIQFIPDSGGSYTSFFIADLVQPFLMNYTFGEYRVQVNFKQNE